MVQVDSLDDKRDGDLFFQLGLQLLLNPLAFLKRPILWLELITKYKVETTGGPNFAYGILSSKYSDASKHKIPLDLSSWKIAFCGAEPGMVG